MDHKRLLPLPFFAFTAGMVMILLAGCNRKIIKAKSEHETLEGTFSTYHAALGSGSGILFRVNLPASVYRSFRIDSFFIKGESQPFTIVPQTDTAGYLEANLFAGRKQPAIGEINKGGEGAVSKKIMDSVFIAHRFYPSWIVATKNSVRQQFDIVVYKDINSKSKE